MSAQVPDPGRLGSVTGVRQLLETMITGPTDGWERPRASVATWVLAHTFVTVVFVISVVGAGMSSSVGWAAAVLVVWALVGSGLVARLSSLLWPTSGLTVLRVLNGRRLPAEIKFGLFFFVWSVAFIAAQRLGLVALVALVATGAITGGLRLAGLDALADHVRDRWYYVSSLFSPVGLITVVSLAVLVIVVFAATRSIIDPEFRTMEATVEEWLGVDLDRGNRLAILLVWPAMTPVVALVCEAVSAVNRYEHALRRQLVELERRHERDLLAQELHDGAILSGLDDLRRRTDDPDQRRVINALELHLRGLQVERQVERGPRSIRAALRHPLHGANLLGIDIDLRVDPGALDAEVPGSVALLVERLAMLQINNSAAAEASAAILVILHLPRELVATYIDDGGGFDPAVISAAGGGMARLQYDIEDVGGTLTFERQERGTASTAHLPLPSIEWDR